MFVVFKGYYGQNKMKWVGHTVLEISINKAVGLLFSDCMCLITHEAPPWLAPSGKILQI